MSETLWGVDLVQSLLRLPDPTCSWLRGIVCVCVYWYVRTACCGEVGYVVGVVCERASPHRVLSRVPRCHRVCELPYRAVRGVEPIG